MLVDRSSLIRNQSANEAAARGWYSSLFDNLGP